MAYRFHVVGLPHTQTRRQTNTCAYTVKVFNFCSMMLSLGHEVFHYGTEGSDPRCTEHVEIITQQLQRELYDGPLHAVPYDAGHPLWAYFNAKAAMAIRNHAQPRDFLCIIGGRAQEPIARQLPDIMAVEYGVGYMGVFSKFRVFESYPHQALIYGQQGPDPDGQFYDCVIPNSFNLADFYPEPDPVSPAGRPFLFIGRMIRRKGIRIAVAATAQLKRRLILAGPGGRAEDGKVVGDDGEIYVGEHLEYVGVADIAARRKLMSSAEATFVPTEYLEPFGAVVVESQLCATPVISTDWGAFSDTVQHGVNGYRCRTLEQFVWAGENAHKLDRNRIRSRATENYSTDRVKHMYEEYFNMLYSLWDKGWYKRSPRTQLDWLNKI